MLTLIVPLLMLQKRNPLLISACESTSQRIQGSSLCGFASPQTPRSITPKEGIPTHSPGRVDPLADGCTTTLSPT